MRGPYSITSRSNPTPAAAARSELRQLRNWAGSWAGKAPAQGGNEQEPWQREARVSAAPTLG